MIEEGIFVNKLPELEKPFLIAGFDGWGNAMNIATGMISYMIRKFKARPFARLNSDIFYRYDENRPYVHIDDGKLINLSPPGGTFYAAKSVSDTKDLILFSADEPSLNWYRFTNDLFSLCSKLDIQTLFFLGSMYDNVLHTDKIVSGITSNKALSRRLKEKNISSVSYQGPGAIHSTLMSEGQKKGFYCFSLWSHCPYYLQGATHFGLMSHLGSLLSYLGEFDLETSDLDAKWITLNEQIQALVKDTPGLQSVIDELRKAKVRGSWERMKDSLDQHNNVINLQDFLEPK